MNTTFGYHPQQDRIWMLVHEPAATIWLTRRMVLHILGPLSQAFEAATPGRQGGAPAAMRAAIEHELALHEVAPGQKAAHIQAGRVQPDLGSVHQGLCHRIVSRPSAESVTMSFESETGPLVVRLDRKGMHLWLQGLVMVLDQAGWNLPEPLPAWLQGGLMPPAIQALMGKPLPKDIDGA